MPGKHHAPPARRPWLLLIPILLALALAGGALLFWQRPDPVPTASQPSSAPSAPAATTVPTPAPTATPTPTPVPSPTPPPIADNGEDGYLSEGLYIWNNMAFELFYGYNEASDPYIEAISSFAQQLPGMRVFNMVVPNHCEFGLPQRLRDSLGCGSQRENTAYIYSNLSGVTPVDIYDALDQHKDEYLYFNTDTHWAGLGAYYAYVEFCAAARVEAVPLEDFTKESYEGFLGYLYQLCGEDCLAQNPDRIDLYEPGYAYTAELSYDGESFFEVNGMNSGDSSMGYSMFLRGDNPCMQIINQDHHTGRKLALVKESYGNAIGPFLAASYDEVFVVDFRSFEGSLPDFCQENKVTDVLFLNSTIAANTGARVDDLWTLFP